MSTQYSKAMIAGHPIHPMLVAFPITFYTSTFVAFVIYAYSGDVGWWQIGLRANVAGVLTAAAAALAMLCLLSAGFLGWKLVQTHHVGVDLSDEQRRLESRTAH